jgi:hypothetical protein
MSEAEPAPTPIYKQNGKRLAHLSDDTGVRHHARTRFVGVLTEMKMRSARRMVVEISVVKKRLGVLPSVPSRATATTSERPGSKIGRLEDLQLAIRASSKSTTDTSISGFSLAITAEVGPPCCGVNNESRCRGHYSYNVASTNAAYSSYSSSKQSHTACSDIEY